MFFFLQLEAIFLSMNNPSAPQSMRAFRGSVFWADSTSTGIEILRFEVERTDTNVISKLLSGVESMVGTSSTVMSPTVKNPLLSQPYPSSKRHVCW